MVIVEKACKHCHKSQPLSNFHRSSTREDGHGPSCKTCVKTWNQIYQARHRDKIVAKRKIYWRRADVKERTNAYQKQRNRLKMEKNATRPRPEHCEICGNTGRICYDHNHETGAFRGWLCSPCNLYLGGLKDNIDLLHKMIAYLVKNGH